MNPNSGAANGLLSRLAFQRQGELTGARWRNAELQTAVSELLAEMQGQEAEAERLRGALEIAQLAAEEATRELSEREVEAETARREVERLRRERRFRHSLAALHRRQDRAWVHHRGLGTAARGSRRPRCQDSPRHRRQVLRHS